MVTGTYHISRKVKSDIMKKIYVFGSINADLFMKIEKLPTLGETIHATDFHVLPGGKGANQCIAAAKLGGKTHMLGHLGNDMYSDFLSSNFLQYAINNDGIIKIDMSSGIAIVQNINTDNSIIVSSGANFSTDCTDIHRILHTEAEKDDLLVVQFEKEPNTILDIIKIAKTIGMKIIINPAPMKIALLKEILPYADYLILNETEFASVFNTDKANIKLIVDQYNLSTIILTLGKKGVICATKNNFIHFNGHEVDAVDSTGAGDCFVGALSYFLSEGDVIEDAVQKANLCAAISVTKIGAQTGMPTFNEFLRYWQKMFNSL